ncbi:MULTISPECIES: hypothetical protein [unclassified Thioalkalivibrio]|uniref:hypothetical protein n=2 Tax=Thioalkalivibrio TaxID=106633 RepID=UPI001E514C64|nr:MULTISPECIES: hypothetical protein [unclassified Thioalkalivibrio]
MTSGQVHPRSAGRQWHVLMQALVAGIVSLFLLVGGLWVWLATGDRSGHVPGAALEIPAETMSLVEGEAAESDDGVHLLDTGARDRAALLVTLPPELSDIARFDTLEINLHSPGQRPGLTLIWGEVGSTTAQHFHVLPPGERMVALEDVADWLDELGLLGLGLEGSQVEGTRLESIVLREANPGFRQVLSDLFRSWGRAMPFSQSTINVIPSSGEPTLVPPTLAAALWLLVALLLLSGYRLLRHQPFSITGALVIALFAWLALDLRWQVDLVREHRATWEAFQGVPAEQRSFPALGGEDLLELTTRARADFPQGSRVLIVSGADGMGLYARYRLMPLAGSVQDEISNDVLQFARPGDGLLLLGGEAASNVARLRRELPFAYRARFPLGVGPEQMRGPGVLREATSRGTAGGQVFAYQGAASDTLVGQADQAFPAAVYRAVVRLEVPEPADRIHFEVLQRVGGPDGGRSSEPIAERVLDALPEQGVHEHAIGFGLPTRGELEFRLSNLPAGTHVEGFRLEYPDNADEWYMTSHEGQPPHRAGRLVMYNELGLLLELQ